MHSREAEDSANSIDQGYMCDQQRMCPDDLITEYSQASATDFASQKGFIWTIAASLANSLPWADATEETRANVCAKLPQLLQEFATRLGIELVTNTHLDLMLFVQKYKRCVGCLITHFRRPNRIKTCSPSATYMYMGPPPHRFVFSNVSFLHLAILDFINICLHVILPRNITTAIHNIIRKTEEDEVKTVAHSDDMYGMDRKERTARWLDYREEDTATNTDDISSWASDAKNSEDYLDNHGAGHNFGSLPSPTDEEYSSHFGANQTGSVPENLPMTEVDEEIFGRETIETETYTGDTQTHCIQQVDETDDEEASTRGRLPSQTSFKDGPWQIDLVSATTAYQWLVHRLQREFDLEVVAPNFLDTIQNTVRESLPVESISSSTCPQRHSALLQVNWSAWKFFETQEYSGRPDEELERVVTITGASNATQAATCRQYFKQTWPVTGDIVINLIKEILEEATGTRALCKYCCG